MKFCFVFKIVLLLGYIEFSNCASLKLKEDEIVPAILSKFIGSSSRLELEKHRQNKTTYSALVKAQNDALHEENGDDEAIKALLLHQDPKEQTRLFNLERVKQDAIIRQLWNGTCKLEHWTKCNNITTWGGDYFVDGKLEHFEMECTEFNVVCMRNGWSVNRCHLLCMSECNRDLLVTRSYDKYVIHEGYCSPDSQPILKHG